MIIGIILAAGKGTRIKAKTANKVTLPFLNKPLIIYSVELLEKVADKIFVVIGAFHESVKKVLKRKKVFYAYQKKRLGTGHAVKVAVEEIIKKNLKPEIVLVGYGDHTMFYKKEDIEKLIALHHKEKAVMSIITTESKENEKLHWGYILRDKKGNIVDSVEYKDANDEIKKNIKELNAGFYCFDFDFLKNNLKKIPKSKVSGEYYINSLIKIASGQNLKVVGLKIPFSSVGIGVNTWSELDESQRIYLSLKK
jgi:N-acetylglucosamine-1-phosphate uridyltransferase (contains nucleotidyltransferase and I-patch acetyltransferase domains)